MMVLKWLLIAGLLLYGGGLAFLFFQQRSMLFPIPRRRMRRGRGLSGSRRAGADGRRWREGHHLGMCRPSRGIRWCCLPGNGDFLAGRVSRFKASRLTAPVSSRCPIAAMRARADHERARIAAGCGRGLCLYVARYDPGRVVAWGFSLAPALRSRWRRSIGSES